MRGTAADLIKLAMIAEGWLEQEKLQTKLVMQVHDELVLGSAGIITRARERQGAGADDQCGDAGCAAGGGAGEVKRR